MTLNLMPLLLEFTDHLIELMGLVLCAALFFRLMASKSSRRDQIYFKGFSRAVEKTLEVDKTECDLDDVDGWLVRLLNAASSTIPARSVRYGLSFGKKKEETPSPRTADGQFRFRDKESLSDFAHGKKSIVHGIRQHLDVLKSPYPPNFSELTYRILDQDREWKTVAGVSIEIVSRMLDILPGMFVVGGILGTFVGIATGLPKIGMIDMNKITESAPVLASFIESVALSMRTSIAGIMFSIAMTMLNTMFPIHSQRVDVEKNVQRCLELIWHRIHGDKPSYAESRIIELLSHIHAALSPADDKPAKKAA